MAVIAQHYGSTRWDLHVHMEYEREGPVKRVWVMLTASPTFPVPFQLEQGMNTTLTCNTITASWGGPFTWAHSHTHKKVLKSRFWRDRKALPPASVNKKISIRRVGSIPPDPLHLCWSHSQVDWALPSSAEAAAAAGSPAQCPAVRVSCALPGNCSACLRNSRALP